MGAGIAQIAAAAGHTVRLLDNRPGAAEKAADGIRAQFVRLAEKGKLSRSDAVAAGLRLKPVTEIRDLADSALVVEAIVENLQAKQQLFRELESIVSRECILATNTSAISVTAIGSALASPERLGGLHFFNPAPLMALVEVVSGLSTDKSVAETLYATAAAWGKSPVHTRSTPGFIVNRVARPYYAESLRVMQEGGADPATIDACAREAGGFRMGPFELMDLIGHDVNLTVTKTVWNAFYNDQRFLPSLIQQELVDAGFFGKKTGRGFYDYREGAVGPQPQTEPAVAAGRELHAAKAVRIPVRPVVAPVVRVRDHDERFRPSLLHDRRNHVLGRLSRIRHVDVGTERVSERVSVWHRVPGLEFHARTHEDPLSILSSRTRSLVFGPGDPV